MQINFILDRTNWSRQSYSLEGASLPAKVTMTYPLAHTQIGGSVNGGKRTEFKWKKSTT